MHHLGLLNDGGFHEAMLEEKSPRKAARKLTLSPARVSELVRNLDTRVRVRLVKRTSRSVAASPAEQ
jgi:DNA-binding transcriptional LysR family regulator